MTKKVKVKAGDEKSITVHADRDLFGRLLIVANARQINLMEVLSYELSPIPCSLAHQDGSLRKNTKNHLAGIIEKLVIVVPQLQPSPENTVYILDGLVNWPIITSTPSRRPCPHISVTAFTWSSTSTLMIPSKQESGQEEARRAQ